MAFTKQQIIYTSFLVSNVLLIAGGLNWFSIAATRKDWLEVQFGAQTAQKVEYAIGVVAIINAILLVLSLVTALKK